MKICLQLLKSDLELISAPISFVAAGQRNKPTFLLEICLMFIFNCQKRTPGMEPEVVSFVQISSR